MQSKFTHSFVAILFFYVFILSCSASFKDKTIEPKIQKDDSDLQSSAEELIREADSILNNAGSAQDFEQAIRALKKADGKISRSGNKLERFDIHFRLAMACFGAFERGQDTSTREVRLNEGESAARAAVEDRPDRVEGHYYLAVIAGRKAESSGIAALNMLKDIEMAGLKAAELDQTFELGGPHRLLAMLYAKAPSWPSGVGDMDLAVEHAKKALTISDYPLNHLIMAEVLIENDKLEDAAIELQTVLAAPKEGRWAIDRDLWLPRAKQLLEEIK